jgi:hypothetical protein
METPFRVDREATLDRYSVLHAHFETHVAEIANLIRDEKCDGVFANVGYLPILAAKRAGRPVVACSSLNWSDVFWAYCEGMPRAESIRAQMDEAYRNADVLIRLAPGMPMERFDTELVERPIARRGRDRRQELTSELNVPAESLLVLCAFGGMLPSTLPRFASTRKDLVAIGPAPWASDSAVVSVDSLTLPFEDIFSSVDVIVTKPGYGVVAELGCTGKPGILISRGDWPEENYLTSWLQMCGRVAVVSSLEELSAESLLLIASTLIATPPSSVPRAGGEAIIGNMIRQKFSPASMLA